MTGVASEVEIARAVGVRYVLLRGYKDGTMKRPVGTSCFFDVVYGWTWENMRKLTDTRP
jgi:hypothetical protein